MPDVFDAIVVGTGFGGAVTACRLAQAGLKVCVLERGRRYDLSSIPALPKDGQTLPDARRWTWGGSQGLWDLRNLDGVTVAQSAAYGGGSLIYANVHLRPPEEVFNADWPSDCHRRTGLDRFFDLVGYMLDIRPVPKGWRTQNGKIRVMYEAFRNTARGVAPGSSPPRAAPAQPQDVNVFFPPLAIRFPEDDEALWKDPGQPPLEGQLRLNKHDRPQGECRRCGACDFGCRYGAKNTLDRNYLAIAEDSRDPDGKPNVTVRTLMEVLTVSWDAGRALHEVRCLDHLVGGSNVSFTARYVFLCAGSVNTTELLLRSQGDQKRRGLDILVQTYLVTADSLASVVHAGAETFASEGPVITSALVFQKEKIGDGDREAKLQRPHKSSPRTWFLIEDGGYPREAAKLFSLFQSPALLGRNHFDPDPAPPKILSTVKELFDRPRPDRYPAFLDGFVAALVAGTLPDVLAQDFKDATTSLKKLAGGLRDAEIGDLTSEIRDAVVFNSVLFRFLERLKVYKLRRLWIAIYRFSVWFMKIDDAQLLSTTLGATHHRYGVDKPRGLPSRISRLLLGEPYPVNESRSRFDPKPPPRPQERAQALLLAMGRDDIPAHLKLDGDRLIAWFPEEASRRWTTRSVSCAASPISSAERCEAIRCGRSRVAP